MSDIVKLKKAIGLIATGLHEKIAGKEPGKYMNSVRLIHGINMFQSINIKYSCRNKEDLFKEFHEEAFIRHYATVPVAEWFKHWDEGAKKSLRLEENSFYYLDALVADIGFNQFCLTDECEDYIDSFEKDIISGIEQREVYEKLKVLNQKEYTYMRKFIVN